MGVDFDVPGRVIAIDAITHLMQLFADEADYYIRCNTESPEATESARAEFRRMYSKLKDESKAIEAVLKEYR